MSSFNAAYLESLEQQYLNAPASLEPSWRLVFDALHESQPAGYRALHRPAFVDHLRAHGHLQACLDPLAVPAHVDPDPEAPIAWSDGEARWLQRYAGQLGVEAAHIDDAALRQWIAERVEGGLPRLSAAQRLRALGKLAEAEEFERFLSLRFPGKKRFGAEGAQALVPLLDAVLQAACAQGVTDVVIGTMHRGRLGLMANVLGKPLAELLAQFKGAHPLPGQPDAPADVAYHLGGSWRIALPQGSLQVCLLPNPSHLEAVNVVALGSARARQDVRGDRRRVLPVLLHTDASVIGQGVVAEAVQLAGLQGYATGGTLHIVVNNQIGFTTEPHEARSSRYCTGAWKAVDSLILHVNGDAVDTVLRSAGLALAFRQAHAADAVIDLVCLRRNGHNEFDEPRFTQPLRYRRIDATVPLWLRYGERLQKEGLADASGMEAAAQAYRARLNAAYDAAAAQLAAQAATTHHAPPRDEDTLPATGVSLVELERMATALTQPPTDLRMHPVLQRVLREQAQALPQRLGWPLAEALAFGSLVAQGIPVRLSGQDARRGAFSQRHFAWIDQDSGAAHVPVQALARDGAVFEAINSPLSEYAVLGFEYGYSLERARALVIWEAQFGDFANGAQIVVDQFLAAARAKWAQESALVLLLPHGLEGQGPEHSSARIERWLQLCADDNLRVVQPSTPANYFHLLRGQALSPRRRPLVVFSAKTLLRHAGAVASLGELATGTAFEPVRVCEGAEPVRRVLLCSGKFGWELLAARASLHGEDTAVVFLDQLYPLPAAALRAVFRRWPQARYAWVQEEPCNMGAWSWLDRPLEQLAAEAGVAQPRLRCVARPASASPAGSFHGAHEADQQRLVRAAFESHETGAARPQKEEQGAGES